MAANDRRFPCVRAGGGDTYSLIGELITFKITSAETGGAFSVMELTSPPQGGPPLHRHAAAETFLVLEGEFEFSGLDQGERYTIRATPGDIVYIPGGAAHTYKTVSPAPGKAIGVLAPGGEMERFFAEVGELVSDQSALTVPAGPPSEAEVARHMAIAARHGIVFLPPDDVMASEAHMSERAGSD
ncbi:MAG TPA: cupin domain-containing protein [Ktedonobacterales bacterium]|nr:cupin domain-containing protein [Ktedonobacterales bacterium]